MPAVWLEREWSNAEPPGSTLAKPAHRPDVLREGRVVLEAAGRRGLE